MMLKIKSQAIRLKNQVALLMPLLQEKKTYVKAIDRVGFYSYKGYEQSQKFIKKNPVFSWVVLIPWLLVASYMFCYQSPQYESNAKILIEKDDDKTPMNISFGFLGSSGTGNASNTYLTQEFILSREMLAHLQHEINIKEHYQGKSVDVFSRLKKHPNNKEFLDYYNSKVAVVVDSLTDELDISVNAFSSEMAQKTLKKIVVASKEFVNRVANSLASKQHRFAKAQLSITKKKLFDAETKMLAFQNKHHIFDPKESAKVVAGVMAKLKEELVTKQTELITAESFMQPASSKVISLKEAIEALKHQMEMQTSDLLGKSSIPGGKLNQIMVDYEWQELRLKFAQAEYKAAQQAYDISKINLSKQQNLVVEIESPNLPDTYTHPQIAYNLVNLLAMLLMVFVLGKMTVMIVKEHMD